MPNAGNRFVRHQVNYLLKEKQRRKQERNYVNVYQSVLVLCFGDFEFVFFSFLAAREISSDFLNNGRLSLKVLAVVNLP